VQEEFVVGVGAVGGEEFFADRFSILGFRRRICGSEDGSGRR